MSSRQLRLLLSTTFAGLALLPAIVGAGNNTFKIATVEVAVLCPLTIGGDFEAKTTTMSGDMTVGEAGAVKGTLAVDLMKLDTGISLRDRHLRTNYLEVQKGPDFAVAKLANLKLEHLPGKGTFKALLTLHGQQHEVTGSADVQQNGAGYRVVATFPMHISEFQIPDPTYLGVGVKDEITIRVKLDVAPAAAAAVVTSEGGSK
jgi:polyisoprenoid-binding protein YceI